MVYTSFFSFHIYALIYEIGIDHLIYKAEIETQTLEIKGMDTKGKEGGGMNWEIGIDIYTLLIPCIK